MGQMWRYFRDILHWGAIRTPGPLQALTHGAARSMDQTRDDMLYLRDQWFPALCEPELVADHGAGRGLVRHSKETPDQYRARVVNAYAWHMLGGKHMGVPEILAAYGYHVQAVENMRRFASARWAEFMVRLDTPAHYVDQQAQLEQLEHLVWLILEYKPARSFFFRIYNGTYDRRPIVPGIGPTLGAGLLSFWSGTADPGIGDGDVLISFGVRIRLYGPALFDSAPQWGLDEVLTLHGPRRANNFVLGVSRLSDVYIRRNPFVCSEVVSIGSGEDVFLSGSWGDGEWDDRPWERWEGFIRAIPPMELGVRHIARSQLELGASRLSGLNARPGGVRHVVPARGVTRVGRARLGCHGPVRTPVCLLVYETERRALPSAPYPALAPGQCWGGESLGLGGRSPWNNSGTWEEEDDWNAAPWDGFEALMGVTIREE